MASNIPSQPSTSKEPPKRPSILKRSSAPKEPPKKCSPEQTDKSDRIFIEVLRKNIHYILDVKLNTTAEIIKRMIEGISKFPPENQRIHYEDRIMGPTDTLGSIGITKEMASLSKKFVQLGLAIKEDGVFEKLEIQPVADPPELPEVFKEYESELDPKEADVPQSAGPSVSSDDGVCPGAATAAAQIAAKRAAKRAAAAAESAAAAAAESASAAGPSGEGDSAAVSSDDGVCPGAATAAAQIAAKRTAAASASAAGPSGEGDGAAVSSDDGVCPGAATAAAQIASKRTAAASASAAGPSGEGDSAAVSSDDTGVSPAKLTKR